VLLDKGRPGRSGATPCALWSIQAPFGPRGRDQRDSSEQFFDDMVRAGRFIGDQNIVEVVAFATKQYRMPADPGNKTDETDLYAQHRAAVAGFGLCELELESPYRELQLRSRHRRNLVEMASSTRVGPPPLPHESIGFDGNAGGREARILAPRF
jgi:hypothetical protein